MKERKKMNKTKKIEGYEADKKPVFQSQRLDRRHLDKTEAKTTATITIITS